MILTRRVVILTMQRLGRQGLLEVKIREADPLGPLGFNLSQHGPTTRPSVERTAEKAFLLPDRV